MRVTITEVLNMCNIIKHVYSCGHTLTEKAPCAGSKAGHCSGNSTRTKNWNHKCDSCDP